MYILSSKQKKICNIHFNRFEGGGGGQNGLQQYPTLSHVGGPFSLREAFVWFDFLLAALDCYTWVFGERLLSPSQVFVCKYVSQYLEYITE